MRLTTIQTAHGPRAALVQRGHFIDLHATDSTLPPTLRGLLAAGPEMLLRVQEVARRPVTVGVEAGSTAVLPPIPDPQKIICIGLNYRDHALEQNTPVPKEPVVFSKFPTALIAENQPIRLPRASQEVDFEAELVVVLGRRGRDVPRDRAMEYVAGYMVGNDVSARDWQKNKEGRQWLLGKSFDTFAPTGPAFVTRDEVPDPHQLPIRLRLNGQVMQESNTSQLLFNIPTLLEYVSQVCTLEPGDLLFTGTPAGVGFARKPPIFLKDGDTVEVEIEGLGVLRNPVEAV